MNVSALPKMEVPYPSVMTVGSLWKSHVKANFGIERQLTPKEFGQLKMIRDGLGVTTSEVIERTLDNWPRFCLQARENAGLPCVPSVPHIGFLLAHYDTAVNLMYAIAKSKTPGTVGDTCFINQIDCLNQQQKKKFEAQLAAWEAS